MYTASEGYSKIRDCVCRIEACVRSWVRRGHNSMLRALRRGKQPSETDQSILNPRYNAQGAVYLSTKALTQTVRVVVPLCVESPSHKIVNRMTLLNQELDCGQTCQQTQHVRSNNRRNIFLKQLPAPPRTLDSPTDAVYRCVGLVQVELAFCILLLLLFSH